ncbi:MAG: V-type ATPase subunit a family protein [Bacteroides sp.]|nr:V-type ATPase subunit a family protein [Bacteroides sp.]MCM1549833.1 V-type ATPase subunit a family protein [Clostridium sp.]
MELILDKINYLAADTSKRFDRLEERFDRLEERFDRLEKRVDKLEERVDSLTEQMGELTNRVDSLTEQMGGLTNRVDGLEQANTTLYELMMTRTDDLGRENRMILDEVERVHKIMISRTDQLKEKIG